MLRKISVSLRLLQSRKEVRRTLSLFDEWKQQIAQLPANKGQVKKMLIIRLDDIGDYLLFRNTLPAYRESPKWAGYEITLLGNVAYKDIFHYADNAMADKTIWVNKHEYFGDEQFRKQLWERLRADGFDTVICPSHSRPLLLDDVCMLAAGAANNLAVENDLDYPEINALSDKMYTARYQNDKLEHELFYNRGFANWCCNAELNYTRPFMTPPGVAQVPQKDYIIFFVGASKQSKLWAPKRWIELVNIYKADSSNCECIIAGGKGDKEIADEVVQATGARSIAGEISLVDMIDWIANAKAVVTNDTMTPHLAVSCGTPTVIVANGVNFYKFCAYEQAGIAGVVSVYPDNFLRMWKQKGYKMFRDHLAVTKDITTIQAETVYNALKELLSERQ